ncbi:MAG: HyaD/HybD family hydrogenase maturation endopeptidase [Candidatus Aminicenantes bacterium]|nr:HyaD/HybD family hydrogenase maturation endopeptidase [Candidatus Aminicenantes bacterium]
MSGPDRAIVLGLGNLLNRDEGLGVQCLEPLRNRLGSVAGIEILDGGVLGLDLLPLVECARALLILDAVDARKPPGTLIELTGADIPLFGRAKLSWHQVTFQEVLQLAAMRNRLPERLHLVGVQPADLSIGLELSPEVAAAMPALIEHAAAVLAGWGFYG